jgi:hypothetical protein
MHTHKTGNGGIRLRLSPQKLPGEPSITFAVWLSAADQTSLREGDYAIFPLIAFYFSHLFIYTINRPKMQVENPYQFPDFSGFVDDELFFRYTITNRIG